MKNDFDLHSQTQKKRKEKKTSRNQNVMKQWKPEEREC